MQHNGQNTATAYVHSLQNGEEKGFNFFFREYYSALCYFSFQITRDKLVAEEISGDAFIKLWERCSGFENTANIKSFLYRIVRNASIDWLRRQKTKQAHTKEIAILTSEKDSFVLEKIIETETYREVLASLKILAPQCRKIFCMFYLEGKDYNQIARELRLSINTIRVQKARALSALRKKLSLGLIFIIGFASAL